MTIEDINHLKKNSVEDIHKIHIHFNSNNIISKIDTITNVFAINIYKISMKSNIQEFTPFKLKVYANNILMDSIYVVNSNDIILQTREFEKCIHPITSLEEITIEVDEEKKKLQEDIDLYISVSIHNYKPYTEFNDIYNELNPQYNPNDLIWGNSDSEYDS